MQVVKYRLHVFDRHQPKRARMEVGAAGGGRRGASGGRQDYVQVRVDITVIIFLILFILILLFV